MDKIRATLYTSPFVTAQSAAKWGAKATLRDPPPPAKRSHVQRTLSPAAQPHVQRTPPPPPEGRAARDTTKALQERSCSSPSSGSSSSCASSSTHEFTPEQTTYFLRAVMQHQYRFVDQLLSSYPMLLNVRSFILSLSPLHCAAINGDEKMIHILLKHGADVRALTTDLRRPVDVLFTWTGGASNVRDADVVSRLRCMLVHGRSGSSGNDHSSSSTIC